MRLRFLALGLVLVAVAGLLTRLAPEASLVEVPLRAPELPPGLRRVASVPAEPGALAGRNLLLVTLDTTRPDRIGVYGNTAIETPTLDRLAREGVVFSGAVAVAPTTLPSHASILTGLYPLRHGARANSRFRLDREPSTLAELLVERGYDTAAFVSALVLHRRFGLARGFRRYDDRMASRDVLAVAERPADDTTRRAVRWLERQRAGPFFAWVHYYDPHSFWQPPADFAARYALAYDGEIAFVDQQLGRLIAATESAGGDRGTLIVVVGDHGEALGEHGESTHGMLLQEAVLRIPLILHGPGLGPGVHVPTRVSQVDLMPTILSLLGATPPADLDGADLTSAPDEGRALYAENLEVRLQYGWARLAALYAGDLKLVDGPRPELYDLAADPLDRDDVAEDRPGEVERLGRRLRAFQSRADDVLVPSVDLAPDEVQRLASLGYVVGDAEPIRAGGPGTDPKAMAPLMERVQLLVSLAEQPQPAWARWLGRLSGTPIPQGDAELTAELEAIAEAHPDFPPVYSYLTDLYRAAGREAEAKRSEERMKAAIRAASSVRQ